MKRFKFEALVVVLEMIRRGNFIIKIKLTQCGTRSSILLKLLAFFEDTEKYLFLEELKICLNLHFSADYLI